ncbi:MAG TPA: hypothetical protein O0X21_03165 [Methanocorpusculum sp.]|nr:hypothetical protein [Methanocorpusculum sp.]
MSADTFKALAFLLLLGLVFFWMFSALQGSPYEIPTAYFFLLEFLIIGAGGAFVYSLANRN